jgi:hypothetical protein
MGALAASTDDELYDLILSTLNGFPGTVSAWTARLGSRAAALRQRGPRAAGRYLHRLRGAADLKMPPSSDRPKAWRCSRAVPSAAHP